MENSVMYNVLWVDDQIVDKHGNVNVDYMSMQMNADDCNIRLVPFGNWEEAEDELRKNFEEYSAIILDANCKIKKTDIEKEEFITAVLPSLTNVFGEKRKLLPWYIFSAGTMSSFDKIVQGASYQHAKHEEDWGNMLYLKIPNSEEQSYKKLFENIARVAKDSAINIVLYRHYDTFCYLGKDKLIDERARKLMLRMLCALYYPEDNINYEYESNPLRKVLEYLFRSAHRYGLLPKECVGDSVNIFESIKFLSGDNINVEGIKVKCFNTLTPEDEKSIFPKDIKGIVKSIQFFTNKGSHTSRNCTWCIDEERKDIFFGYVLQMCHVIKWFGNYVNEHNNVEENKAKYSN